MLEQELVRIQDRPANIFQRHNSVRSGWQCLFWQLGKFLLQRFQLLLGSVVECLAYFFITAHQAFTKLLNKILLHLAPLPFCCEHRRFGVSTKRLWSRCLLGVKQFLDGRVTNGCNLFANLRALGFQFLVLLR